jgi:D-arabinose 1-dehydrogenase-like Zn-dependent alcohol dehydrogenase
MDNHCTTPRYVGLQRPGAYADHLVVPHPQYLIDTSGVDPAWAATLSCSGLATYSAVSKLDPILPEEWVAVIGVGGLGLTAIAMLRAIGHERIIAVDIDATKLKAAGVAATVDARAAEASKEIQRIADGPIYGAIDLVGTSNTASLALGALRKGGRLILVGLYGGEIPVSLVTTVQRALTIQGSHLGSLAELKSVVALVREGRLQPIPIERRPLSEVNRTLDELKAGAILGRVVVEI